MRIALLPKSLQNQIAAGEVVERPASIVKELVENSIDAGADEVVVDIEEGGVKKIRITDNGKGVEKDDLPLVMQRYATSKISKVEDLFALQSFGFRGEAIASIASVSHFTLRSRHENAAVGYEIKSSSDDILPASCPIGTECLVENLFWNTPARRKFLKTDTTEAREITKVVEKFALSHPSASFRLINNGKEVFYYTGISNSKNFEKRFRDVLGGMISEELIPLYCDGGDFHITGATTHPNFHRSTRDKQFIFVNNRMISGDKHIFSAVNQAYQTLLPTGKHPAFVLHITLDPEKVDVNVHPRKTEVQFFDAKEVFQKVKNSFSQALSGNKYADHSDLSFPHSSSFSQNDVSPQLNHHCQHHYSHASASIGSSFSTPFPKPSSEKFAFPSMVAEEQEERDWKVVAQVRKSFIILEEKGGMRIVDQHAAHERVRLEQLEKDYAEKSIQSQPLLTPVVFSVSQSEKSSLLDQCEYLREAGFDISDFGGNEVSINAVPAGSEHVDISKMFQDLIADSDFFDPSFSEHHKSFAKRALSYSACRGAKKFGHALSFPEMERLIEDWKNCTHPDSCAHGRPVSIFYPYKDLENECGRY